MIEQRDYDFPKNIICLTEESVETLFLLGKQDYIKGVSAFVKRPPEAMSLPKVSLFTSSNYDKILAQKPDLILGHSDIQKDIARDLIELGQDVYISNHRSLNGIIHYIKTLSRIVDAKEEGDKLAQRLLAKINEAKEFAKSLQYRPKIYFEEWDEPRISAIQWVSELLDICGAQPIFKEKASGILAKERFVNDEEIIKADPDIILLCWCGKKARIEQVKSRDGYSRIKAITHNRVFEVKPDIFLQPGPAPIIDGIDIIIDYISRLMEEKL